MLTSDRATGLASLQPVPGPSKVRSLFRVCINSSHPACLRGRLLSLLNQEANFQFIKVIVDSWGYIHPIEGHFDVTVMCGFCGKPYVLGIYIIN